MAANLDRDGGGSSLNDREAGDGSRTLQKAAYYRVCNQTPRECLVAIGFWGLVVAVAGVAVAAVLVR